MIKNRFHAVLICDDADCGEIVHVAGDTEAVQELDEEYGWYTDHKLRPQSFFPAPPMFSLPGGTPKAVQVEIESSFAIAWQDQNFQLPTACE